MTQESDRAEAMRERSPGQLTADEESFLGLIRMWFSTVLEGHVPFSSVAQEVSELLVYAIRNRLNLKVFQNADAASLVEKLEEHSRLRPTGDRRATEAEEEFARDVLAATDFAVANGLSFASILNMVAHDLREILNFGSLDEALRRGVLPKCRRYRVLSELPIGETVQD